LGSKNLTLKTNHRKSKIPLETAVFGGNKWGSLWQKEKKTERNTRNGTARKRKQKKTKILDEYLKLLGLTNRKHAI
jgi:hypothetical protein